MEIEYINKMTLIGKCHNWKKKNTVRKMLEKMRYEKVNYEHLN